MNYCLEFYVEFNICSVVHCGLFNGIIDGQLCNAGVKGKIYTSIYLSSVSVKVTVRYSINHNLHIWKGRDYLLGINTQKD